MTQVYSQASGNLVVGPTKTDTEYHVLRGTHESGDEPPVKYSLVERNLTARTAEAAIRKYAEKAGEHADGLYVAVPSRSWKPQTVWTKVEPTLMVEDARSSRHSWSEEEAS